MKKLLVFGASSSSTSINHRLVTYAASLLHHVETRVIRMVDYEMPLYSKDREQKTGIPEKAQQFKQMVRECDGIMISFAEHNGAYSAVFKNLFDWISRVKGSTWEDKPMFLMATSPGARGGASVLGIASKRFPFNGGDVKATFSLPRFNDFFNNNAITDPELLKELKNALAVFIENLDGVVLK